MPTRRLISALAACLALGACSKSESRTSLADFTAKNAAKIEALKANVTRAASAVGAAASAPAGSCGGLDLRLNGKGTVGTTEVYWADTVSDVLAGKHLDASKDPHLVANVDLAGWCQLLGDAMYWLDPETKTDLNTDGVSPKVAGWINSALDLQYLVLVEPGPATRGEQQVMLSVVELASGAVRCSSTVTGTADPSLGVEHYVTIRVATGEQVGKHELDKYSQAMRLDLVKKLGDALRNQLGLKMRGYCSHP